ncbi:hypothetical protein BO83DRAFT_125537 [Aspergillus eucalypticola CBS 122712]|uniref:Uncharacterized protein n=1 Tax=Aspergillus eucalypticola (strain CBS 122712 / IBT 29274) TaxID=1448314 RepID=A0A317UUT1_ASPEC|nr:uncharacterized protein BO83DRAFT_125537 [Aspergillus eucalypticola CBS 122712]PWY64838.1 hypothetical protein BO83DRAFT_125537 [Aspergillus eucalypticola CBS 122712]
MPRIFPSFKLPLPALTTITTTTLLLLTPHQTTAYFYKYPALFVYKDTNCTDISFSLVYPSLGDCNGGYYDYAGSFQMFNIYAAYTCNDSDTTLTFEMYNSSGTDCGDESDLLFRQPVTEECTAAEVESPGPLEMPVWFELGCM